MITLYTADQSRPRIPRDYAVPTRSTDRPAEHGPLAFTRSERWFWRAGGLVLVAFWAAVLVRIFS